jgi:tetratricopeptide (TPR) repeat protein
LEDWLLVVAANSQAGEVDHAAGLCELAMQHYPYSPRLEAAYGGLPPRLQFVRTERRLKEIENDFQSASAWITVVGLQGTLVAAKATGLAERAEKLLTSAAGVRPTDAVAQYCLGRCLRMLQKDAAAAAAFEKAAKAATTPELEVMATAMLGDSLSRSAEDRAPAAFKTAMALNRALKPPIVEVAFDCYRFFQTQGDDAQAREILNEILSWEAFYMPARLEQAKRLGQEDKWAQAIGEAELVLRNAEDPQVAKLAHIFLARAFHVTGQEEKVRLHQEWLKSAH